MTSWKRKAIDELSRLFSIVAYLWVLLMVFQFHRGMILITHGIAYSYSQGAIFAIVNAIILGKFVLLAEALHVGERWESKSLLYSTAFKSACFAVVLICCHLVEKWLERMWRHGWHSAPSKDFANMHLLEIFSLALMVFVALIPFFAATELGRVIGRAELKSLVLKRQVTGPQSAGVARGMK